MDVPRAWIAVAVALAALAMGAAEGPAANVRDAEALAARVDRVLADRWAEAGVRPAVVADDGAFLRRASLDVVGTIPTAAEARDFLDDPRVDKRRALIDRLLDSPAYTARAAALWRGLLLPEAQGGLGDGFEAWLRRKVAEEAGYDQIVCEVLTARLPERDPNADPAAARVEPSPAAYYLAKGNRPEDLASGAARVFLGVRLECAQCHDHPFAPWARDQFWGFAAFFAGVAPRGPGEPTAMPGEVERKGLKVPGTSRVVPAAHLDGRPPAWRPRGDGRDALADWVTADDNPYFARAVVNRVWAGFFGVGLVEPVDDLDAADDDALGGLLDEVAAAFRSHGYDLKFLIRAITSTAAYHRSSAVPPGESTPPPLFARMPVRGLSPSQLFDGLDRATGAAAGASREQFLNLFADRGDRPTEAATTILQALALMNGDWIAAATDPTADGVLGAVAEAPYLDTPGRIEALYLSALARRPRPDELALLVAHVDRPETPEGRAEALADVFWAILNGPEFRLNH